MVKRRTDDIPRELERAGALCLAFVNTAVPKPDRRFNDPGGGPAFRFDDYAEWLAWGRRMGALTPSEAELLAREAIARPQDAEAECARVRQARTVLAHGFTDLALGRDLSPAGLEVINAAFGVQRLTPGADPLEFSWQPVVDAVDLERVFVAVAHSAAEVLSSGQLKRLRQCGAEDCWRLFLYRSKRRVWCDMSTCGTRLKEQRRSRRSRY